MSKQTIPVPDIGTTDPVEVIEISVKVGDTVKAEDSLIVLESDKASMEIPSPTAGKIAEIRVKVGDKVKQGDAILVMEGAAEASVAPAPEAVKAAAAPKTESAPKESTPAAEKPAESKPAAATAASSIETINVPDIGSSEKVDVIEVNVKPGQQIAEGDTMIVLESDKASMEIPAPKAGIVRALKLKEGDRVAIGSPILELEVAGTPSPAEAPAAKPAATVSAPTAAQPTQPSAAAPVVATQKTVAATNDVYAGPAVRKFAREMGIDLAKINGSGPKNRVQKDDIKSFVRDLIEKRGSTVAGTGIPAVPDIDFAQFGGVDIQPLSKLHKITASNMHRSWLNVPHVTQFDDVDISELEDFRGTLKAESEKRGVKISPLPFLLKASALALKAHPKFNASLLGDGERIAYKQYVHIGLAVDTPVGLVVPVIRDVDRKSIWELAAETATLAQQAKDRKLKPSDMQGGCFTISSLGSIGGLGFTPIINTPEVAILGVSKLTVKPVWDGKNFVPRKMLPLSLSYDHRAVNGADAGRFFTYLNELLSDIRRLVL
ncbi:MAG: dihydrolipoamide acetyltransferase [Verrucomicrobiaceae bacterium]|nr:dihydrolipoamide acetyltransferase [Verrucomicrobiaceae bacterium]